jgi:HK97 family phage prohead protease
MSVETGRNNERPPRDGLVRAVFEQDGVDYRDAAAEAGGPLMFGHLARFNEWTEIDSIFEGRFMEQIAPGSFTKTIGENRQAMRVLLNHGRDPQLGDKPLGPISDLREDDQGAYYEVPLLDAPYVRDNVLPGLKAGLYGASFRFSVIREDFNKEPKRSDHNPEGIPERTIKEVRLSEFGPVTFPAYDGATAGVRSLTDHYLIKSLVDGGVRTEVHVDGGPVHAATDEEETTQPTSTPTRATPRPSLTSHRGNRNLRSKRGRHLP